ncbi:MAG: phosphoglycerate kinase [Methylophilales bacterium BACL14 MAG-120920-bin58]|jgi:phosphoglycerate kinase|nr:MAG: phosphoglycerate kinase [Methylophilales bacterium BACL14 MAG-120920-bin58]|tara:strand:- start:2964 stop:4142 length:1179 start_codon:yes stop_codon:yes gene_type:complete
MSILNINDVDLRNKKVLIRSDLNVPLMEGHITSDKRIQASIPTIQHAINQGARVMVTSHLGRPIEGKYSEENSLQPIAEYLGGLLLCPVRLQKNWVEEKFAVNTNELVVLENCRFNVGESENNEILAKKYASLTDIFIMDAFGTAHRKQASTYGVAEFSSIACAGFLFASELEALEKVMTNTQSPMIAVVGGSKVSTKLSLLDSLSDKVDQLILGGGIANTFLKAQGYEIGQSLFEPNFIPQAEKIIRKLQARGASLPILRDVVCGKQFDPNEPAIVKQIDQVMSDDMIFDLGPKSMQVIIEMIKSAKTILWNGPLGVFEHSQFSQGTELLAKSIAKSTGYSLAGGGDTISAIQMFGVENDISYISTAGGAFLEFVEGKKLPAIEILEARAS